MKEFIDANGGIIATVIIIIVAFNALVLGLHKALEVIKDKTSSDLDNKLYAVLTPIITILQKILELASAYKPNKQETAKAEDTKSVSTV